MSREEAARRELHRVSLRATPQRLMILTILMEEREARTAEELYRLCAPGVTNLSTVYRTLGMLCQRGLLNRTLGPDGVQGYYLPGTLHRHQLICLECGARQDLPSCPMEALRREIEAQSGYSIVGHSLELTGVCPHCKARKKEVE